MTKDQSASAEIHDHFEEIVDTYAGRYVAVANEELFVGESSNEFLDKSLAKQVCHL